MKLLTKALRKKLKPLYANDGKKYSEQKVIVKFFTPDSNWTWYVTEGQEQENGDIMFYGLVDGFEKEMGYFLLSELEKTRGPFGLHIERDMHFGEHTLDEFVPQGWLDIEKKRKGSN